MKDKVSILKLLITKENSVYYYNKTRKVLLKHENIKLEKGNKVSFYVTLFYDGDEVNFIQTVKLDVLPKYFESFLREIEN